LIGLPPEIGYTYFILPDEVEQPIQSRYLLLFEPDYEALRDRVNLDHLASTEVGELYLNVGADCKE